MSQESEMANLLIQIGEALQPYVEFAEGQKAMLLSRGWSTGPAEQVATVILTGLCRGAVAAVFKGV